MRDQARTRILERRARFLAAATLIGAGVGHVACEAQACLDVAAPCESDPNARYVVEGPKQVCVGEVFAVRYVNLYCGQRTDATRDAKFTSSDFTVVTLRDNASFVAVGPGRAVITAVFNDDSGTPATLEVEVTACTDAASDAAGDG